MVDLQLPHQHATDADDTCCAPAPNPQSPTELFNVLTPPDAYARLEPFLTAAPRTERVPTANALGRVLAEDLHSPADLPSFPRSTMDGFAVRAADTYGTSEGLPA